MTTEDDKTEPCIHTLRAENARLRSELDRARKALKKIAEDPGLRELLATVRFMRATAKAAYDAPTENKSNG